MSEPGLLPVSVTHVSGAWAVIVWWSFRSASRAASLASGTSSWVGLMGPSSVIMLGSL